MSRAWLLLAALWAALLLFASCEPYPKDPEGSLEEALRRGSLRVGAVEAAPWVTRGPDGPAGGVEGELAAAFAEELGLEVEWTWGGSAELLTALEGYELDLLIGGLTEDSPWRRRVGFTLPYHRVRKGVALPPGSAPGGDLDGRTVVVPPASGLEEKLRGEGAKVEAREAWKDFEGAVAGADWQLAEAGFGEIDVELGKEAHVMAVPSGENALLMRLESFLLRKSRQGEPAERLRREAARQADRQAEADRPGSRR